MWRTLGYIPEILDKRSRAHRMFVESGHKDAELRRHLLDELEGRRTSGGAVEAQDLHSILALILESMLPLQENGFRWDFFYNGKLYKDIKSQVADRFNELAIQYGELYSRQSDRDLPKTKFSMGIRKGKLQAKEYTGILLVLLTALQSGEGKELLSGDRNNTSIGAFEEEGRYDDWILLLDTLLQWEAWLKSDEMVRRDVERSFEKHRHLMHLYKRVVRRKEGMGMKIFKFHAIMHMSQDIINFGVPSVYDTGPMESGHKPTKKAAKVTQKNEDTFEKQTSQRLLETHVLELAGQEIAGRPLWKYPLGYLGREDENEEYSGDRGQQQRGLSKTGGTQFAVEYDNDKRQYYLKLLSRLKDVRSVNVEQDFVNFVANLGKKLERWVPRLIVYSTHTRKETIFRGTPAHGGKVWRDWVDIHWADHGTRPAKIWGFVDFL